MPGLGVGVGLEGRPRRPVAPILDRLSVPAGLALSSRRLRDLYAGAPLRPRRSSDFNDEDVPFTATGDLDATALLTFVRVGNRITSSPNLLQGIAITNTLASPLGWNGVTTENTTNSFHRIQFGITMPGGPVSASLRVERGAAGASRDCYLSISAASGVWHEMSYDLTAGTATLRLGNASGTITPDGSGWVLTISGPSSTAGFAGHLSVELLQSPNTRAYVGNGVSSLIVTAAQFYNLATPPFGGAATWYDQSIFGRHVSQDAMSSQPGIVNAGFLNNINGRPALSFDGVSQHLFNTLPFMYAAGGATVFLVLRSPGAADRRILSESSRAAGGGNPIYGFQTGAPAGNNAAMFLRNDAGTSIIPPNITLASAAFNDTPRLLAYRDTGTTIQAFLNGVPGPEQAYTRSGILTLDCLAIGALVRTGLASFFPGSIGEVIVVPGALSLAEIQTVQRDQGPYFNIPVS